MVDDQYRGLLTDREQEILTGETEVSSRYYARVVSRVRNKIRRLSVDATVLRDHHPELYAELLDSLAAESD